MDILDNDFRPNRLDWPKTTEKIWGSETVIAANQMYSAKVLRLEPCRRTSTHKHELTTETLFCESGSFLLYLNGIWIPVHPRASITIPRGSWHSLVAVAQDSVRIIEASSAYSLDDIKRLDQSRYLTREECVKVDKIWVAAVKAEAEGRSPS